MATVAARGNPRPQRVRHTQEEAFAQFCEAAKGLLDQILEADLNDADMIDFFIRKLDDLYESLQVIRAHPSFQYEAPLRTILSFRLLCSCLKLFLCFSICMVFNNKHVLYFRKFIASLFISFLNVANI